MYEGDTKNFLLPPTDFLLSELGITREDVLRLCPELTKNYGIFWFKDELSPQPRITYLKIKIEEFKTKKN
jgi:hypothetical protein